MIAKVIACIYGILSLLLLIFQLIDILKGRNHRALDKRRKRFELYDKIITNVNNEVLSYTYLKDYVGCPISDDMAAYILKSTHFYDFVAVWKNIYTLVVFDPETKKIKIRNKIGLQVKRIVFAILYFIFLSPFLLALIDPAEIFTYSGYLIPLFVISIPFALVAIFFFLFECGNITQAIKLMEKLEKEETHVAPVTRFPKKLRVLCDIRILGCTRR